MCALSAWPRPFSLSTTVDWARSTWPGPRSAGPGTDAVGLWDELAAKSRRIESERVAAVVARGDVEIGFQQVSEIVRVAGATFAGPIPTEFQRVSSFSAGITTRTRNAADAQRLIDFLSSAEVADTIAATGLDPVVLERR